MEKKISLIYQNPYFSEMIGLIGISLLFYLLHWRVFFTHEHVFTHDTLAYYPHLTFLSDAIAKGLIPYWNPYFHSGEPYHYFLIAAHFINWPLILLVIINKFINASPLTLTNYAILIYIFIFTYGCYFFFRYLLANRISALISFTTLLFSSLIITNFRAIGMLLDIMWVPWICLYLLRSFNEKEAINPILAAFFVGMALNSNGAIYWVFFTFIFITTIILINGTGTLFILLKKKKYIIPLVTIIVLTLGAPTFTAYFHDLNDIVPTLRLASGSAIVEGISVNFDKEAGSHSNYLDFLALGITNFYTYWGRVHMTSEVFLYIGIIPLILAFIGIFYGSNKYKIPILLSLVIIMSLMIGKSSFGYQFAYYFFPLFSTIRHMQFFGGFFLFLLVCLVGIGIDYLCDQVNDTTKLADLAKNIFIIYFFYTIVSTMISYFLVVIYYSQQYDILLGSFVCNQFMFLGALIALWLFKDESISLNQRVFILIFFILIDLLHYGYNFSQYLLQPRSDIEAIFKRHTPHFPYKDSRKRFIPKEIPGAMEGNEPLIMKEFTAVAPDGRDFFMLRDYYEFITRIKKPDLFLGINYPKIFFVQRGVINSRENLINLINSLDETMYKKIIFLEETDRADINKRLISLNNKRLILPVSKMNIYKEENPSVKISLIHFDLNKLTIKVDTNMDGFLYYSEAYHKDWSAHIDQEETKIYRANIAFKSIIIPGGNHIVTFEFNPKYFKIAFSLHSLTFWSFMAYFGVRRLFACVWI